MSLLLFRDPVPYRKPDSDLRKNEVLTGLFDLPITGAFSPDSHEKLRTHQAGHQSRDAPMLPDRPLLVKCDHCHTLVWINEQVKVGEIGPWEPEDDVTIRFPDARLGSTPVLQDYACFLEAGISNKQEQFHLRLRVWWAGNDSRRESRKSTPLDSFETENFRALLALLDEAEENDRIMKAEALRELGEFATAEELLNFKFEDEQIQTVDLIRELIKKRITTVAEIKC